MIELTQRFCELQLQLDSLKQLSSSQESEIRGNEAKISYLEKALVEKGLEPRKTEQKLDSWDHCSRQIDALLQKLSQVGLQDFSGNFQTRVDVLQRQLLDLKSEHLLEIEEIRANSLVEVAEEKQRLRQHHEHLI